MLTRADALAEMAVLAADGNSVVLGTLWRERPAVVALVRHFG
jgi:hypothetical protein